MIELSFYSLWNLTSCARVASLTLERQCNSRLAREAPRGFRQHRWRGPEARTNMYSLSPDGIEYCTLHCLSSAQLTNLAQLVWFQRESDDNTIMSQEVFKPISSPGVHASAGLRPASFLFPATFGMLSKPSGSLSSQSRIVLPV